MLLSFSSCSCCCIFMSHASCVMWYVSFCISLSIFRTKKSKRTGSGSSVHAHTHMCVRIRWPQLVTMAKRNVVFICQRKVIVQRHECHKSDSTRNKNWIEIEILVRSSLFVLGVIIFPFCFVQFIVIKIFKENLIWRKSIWRSAGESFGIGKIVSN